MPCSAFDPAVRMALAPFRRERAVKEILLVKALPLRVVLLYRTAGWNARLFRKSLCKRLCKSLKTFIQSRRPFFFPLSRGYIFPPIQRRSRWRRLYALGGRAQWPPSAAGRRRAHGGGSRRLAAETRGGQDTLRVSYPPLDTPTSSLRRDALRLRV